MIRRVHATGGLLGFLTLRCSWTLTALSQLFGSEDSGAIVVLAIRWRTLLLVSALATTGESGLGVFKGRSDALALAKKRRMMSIGPNGALLLMPCA